MQRILQEIRTDRELVRLTLVACRCSCSCLSDGDVGVKAANDLTSFAVVATNSVVDARIVVGY
jgi:hypothetical protein